MTEVRIMSDEDHEWIATTKLRFYAVREVEGVAPLWRLQQWWVSKHGFGEGEWRFVEDYDPLDD